MTPSKPAASACAGPCSMNEVSTRRRKAQRSAERTHGWMYFFLTGARVVCLRREQERKLSDVFPDEFTHLPPTVLVGVCLVRAILYAFCIEKECDMFCVIVAEYLPDCFPDKFPCPAEPAPMAQRLLAKEGNRGAHETSRWSYDTAAVRRTDRVWETAKRRESTTSNSPSPRATLASPSLRCDRGVCSHCQRVYCYRFGLA